MPPSACFLGLSTLDIIYYPEKFPQPNEKIKVHEYHLCAGGPASNAAIAFATLVQHKSKMQALDSAVVLTALGCSPLAQEARKDLQAQGVQVIDGTAQSASPPPLASILISPESGERCVISAAAGQAEQIMQEQAPLNFPQAAPLLRDKDLLLVDGYFLPTALHYAQEARRQKIPVVFDGGSWKSGTEKLLPWVDYCICSADFFPPGCHSPEDTVGYLSQYVDVFVITQGADPLQVYTQGKREDIAVPQVRAIDSLGAGDIFHGAFSYYILQHDFRTSLQKAARRAAQSCTIRGTRLMLSV